jgi:hypothetical protein
MSVLYKILDNDNYLLPRFSLYVIDVIHLWAISNLQEYIDTLLQIIGKFYKNMARFHSLRSVYF